MHTTTSSNRSCSRLANYYCALLNTFLAQTLIGNIEVISTRVLQSPVKNVSHPAFAITSFLIDRRLEAARGNHGDL
jgi:hypothetical protein